MCVKQDTLELSKGYELYHLLQATDAFLTHLQGFQTLSISDGCSCWHLLGQYCLPGEKMLWAVPQTGTSCTPPKVQSMSAVPPALNGTAPRFLGGEGT